MGIPENISKHVRASGEVTTLDTAVTRAKLLMTINSDSVNALTTKPNANAAFARASSSPYAVLSTNKSHGARPPRSLPRCFHCNQLGHVQRNCRNLKCFNCGKLGHLAKDCWHQGNARGAPVQGNRRPSPAVQPDKNDNTIVTVAVVKSTATVIKGTWGGVSVEMMLDSRLSLSLVQFDVLQGAQNVIQVTAARPIHLVTASGDQLPILQHVKASVQLGELHVLHEFVVTLVALVILEIDFLQGNGLTLDFTQSPVAISSKLPKVIPQIEDSMAIAQVIPIYEATQKFFPSCVNQETNADIIDNCAVPNYNSPTEPELPACPSPNLTCLMQKYHKLFCIKPGYTENAWHYIPTVGNPVKVPSRRIPAH